MERLKPLPEFWLVDTRGQISVSEIRRSFADLGFRVFNEPETGRIVKIAHTKPRTLTLWLLTNQDICAKNKITVESYTHNTGKKKK
jgi:hypothetical protein